MPQTYTIQPGDSLSKISEKFYGNFSMVKAIADRNAIANPDLVYPGTVLVLPEIEDAVVISEESKASSSAGLWIVGSLAFLGIGGFLFLTRKKKEKKK